VLFPEKCIEAMLAEARRDGAEVLSDAPVSGWFSSGSHVTVTTAARDYSASCVILTAGPWLSELLVRMPLPLTLERASQFWFDAEPHARPFDPSRLPVFLLEHRREAFFYGIPDLGEGLKVAFHHGGEPFVLDAPRRPVVDAEVSAARSMVDRWLPGAGGPLRDATTCIYTNTPDQHFVIDRHPDTPRVLVASCCSGHGFKFATVIGEVLADLACGVPPQLDVTAFRAGRFEARDQTAG
jgi:sarcosine oxidase